MKKEETKAKKRWRLVGNLVFYGALLLVLLNSNVKSFVLQGLVNTGLFDARIKEKRAVIKEPASFSFYTEKGEVISTADLKGKVVFINFWATWCPPCRAEMPSLQELYNELKEDKRIIFLFINEDEEASKAAEYLQKHSFTLPLQTRAGQVPPEIFSGTLPTTVVLNKDGRVVYQKEGIANYSNKAFVEQLKALL